MLAGFEDWERSGGLFRRGRSGTNYSPIAMETQMFLDQALIQITRRQEVSRKFSTLTQTLSKELISKFESLCLDLNAEQQQQAIANALNSFGDRLAEELLGTFVEVEKKTRFGRSRTTREWIAGPFVRAGETAGEALTRLAISLSTVNQAFDTHNVALYESSLAAAEYGKSAY